MSEQKEILESIRNIIASPAGAADDDILELTQIVNKDGSLSEIKPKQSAAKLETPPIEEPKLKAVPPASKPPADKDILNEIDAILAGDKQLPAADAKDVELEFTPKTEKFEIKDEFEPTPNPSGDETNKTKDSNMSENSGTVLSETSANEARAAIAGLTSKLQSQGKEANKTEPSAPFRSGATVEDLVVEMLKPMMKDWLDSNLPKLVQEIVQKEIQKLVPKD